MTQNIPADAKPDPGWGNDPRDAWRGLAQALRDRFDKCRSRADFAAGKTALSRWCEDGPIRDFALMQEAWIRRNGKMPEPRELTLPKMEYRSPPEVYAAFMRYMGLEETGGFVKTASGDEVFVDDALFKDLNGDWKWGKRGRDVWALYLAEVISRPQEVWRLKRGGSEEIYLLASFARGNETLEAIAVFKRDGEGAWSEGKTAYVFDKPDGIYRKRESLMKRLACVSWIEI